jgi:hypothetical protein
VYRHAIIDVALGHTDLHTHFRHFERDVLKIGDTSIEMAVTVDWNSISDDWAPPIFRKTN